MGGNATLAGFAFTLAGVIITVVVGPLIQRYATRNRVAERDASAASAVSTLAEAMDALQQENKRLRDVQTESVAEATTAEHDTRRLRSAVRRHVVSCPTPDDLRAALDASAP